MRPEGNEPFFNFPPWTDALARVLGAAALFGGVFLVFIVVYATSPETLDVGYQPVQPVPYSHAMHAGELGIDCRYCHNTVERAAQAAVPPAQTCMNCHDTIRANSDKLQLIRESYATGAAVKWVRAHTLPDYVYFNHKAHVNRNVGCVTCHGRIDKMEVVYQAESLRMGWCLECHRNPEKYLRPAEYITKMDWRPEEKQEVQGRRIREENNINPSDDCSTCHR